MNTKTLSNTTKLPTQNANDIVEFNWNNKLRHAVKGANSIDVKYDPMGNRVWKNSSVVGQRNYIVDIAGDLPVILCEMDSDPNYLKKSYYYADGQVLSQRIHDLQDPNIFTQSFYVHDRLGSVRMLVNTSGLSVAAYTYEPFGKLLDSQTAAGLDNPFLFTGQYFDSEIDQYYLRARQYDPRMMRFTSRDTVGGETSEPLSIHEYLYCQNDSINRLDPTGNMYTILEPIVVGHSTHDYAIGVTAYGVATGNWNWITLGINIDRMVVVVMEMSMLLVHEQRHKPGLTKVEKGLINRDQMYNSSMQGSPPNNYPPGTPWWIKVAVTGALLIATYEGCWKTP